MPEQGPFVVGAGMAVSLETSVAEAEGTGSTTVGGKLLDSPLRFPARRGVRVAWISVENHTSEPPGLGTIAPLLGQDGEAAEGEVAVDALVDATKTGRFFLATRHFPHIYWPLVTGHWPLFSGRSASSDSRILQSRWSLRSRSTGSV